jgi:hypothetical protein
MLNIPIKAIMPQRPVTTGITLHIITQKDFTIITIIKITYHIIPITFQVRTIILFVL